MNTVIGFGSDDDDLRREAEFLRQINDAMLNSLLLLSSEPEKLSLAPIVDVRRMRGEDQRFGPQDRRYSSIYFLNDAAVAMCRELGLSLPVIGEASSMLDESSYEMQAHYLPAEHRKTP